MNFWLVLTVLASNALSLWGVHGHNILFTSFHDSGSHQLSMSKLFLKLARSGHNITVVDTTAKKELPDYGFPNVHVIDARCGPDYDKVNNMGELWWRGGLTVTSISFLYQRGDMFFTNFVDEKPDVLTRIMDTEFDLVVIGDLFSVHGMYMVEMLNRHYNTPYIQYGTTFQLVIWSASRAHAQSFFNEPSNAGLLPADISGIYNPSSFYTRICNFYTKAMELVTMRAIAERGMPTLNALMGRKLTFSEHYRKSSLMLTEAFNQIGLPLSSSNDQFPIGAHCPKIGQLPKDFEDFVNDPESKGTIMLAFGSHVRWAVAPEHILKAYFGAFEALTDYRIIFSYNGPPREVSKHIKLSPWAPQKEALNHPKTKLFIGHSGLKSTNEAFCAAIPLILMPSFADQKYNSEFLAYLGYAEFMNKHLLTKEIVLENVYRVLDNYEEKKATMLKLRSIYVDRIMEPMDLAEFYVNKVAATKKTGRKIMFEKRGMYMGCFEYFGTDLALILISLVWFLS